MIVFMFVVLIMLNYQLLSITDFDELYRFHLRQKVYYQMSKETVSRKAIKEEMYFQPGNEEYKKYYLGIYIQQKLVGVFDYLKNYRYHQIYDENYIFIGLLMIDEEYQNQGLATKIINDFLKIDKHYQLGCYVNNQQGFHFWQKMGFQVIDQIENYHQDLNLYVMER